MKIKFKNLTQYEKEGIIDFYQTPNSGAQTEEKFNISEYTLHKVLDEFNVNKHSQELIADLRIKTNLQKYGAKNPMQNKQVQDKVKQTCLERYGVENVFANSNIQEKSKQTCMENYGVERPMQSQEIRDKYHNTCLQKYGAENTGQFVKQKREKTMLTKYGTTVPFHVQEFKYKAIQTCLKNYGVDNPSKSSIIQAKKMQTCYTNYGVQYPQQSLEIHKKSTYSSLKSLNRGRYKFNCQIFDSKPELAFYIYNYEKNLDILREPCRLEYYHDGIKHYCFPDFMINGQLLEIKGKHLYDKMLIPNTQDNAKLSCLLDNNVIILLDTECKIYIKYCEDVHGKDFHKKYKNIHIMEDKLK